MGSTPGAPPTRDSSGGGVVVGGEPKGEEGGGPLSLVDPFLVEALENPRHRLTVLWMELDVQKFMQNPDEHQFEFQHLPSSYLRRACHLVAQHYGLQTIVLDNVLDGMGRIVVRKTPESRCPAVRLSDVPVKQLENEKPEQVKIAIRSRPNRASLNDAIELGFKWSPMRTVEEREEEYQRARARIFSGSCNPEVSVASQAAADGRSLCLSREGNEAEGDTNIVEEPEPEENGMKNGSSRVAIFRNREKDRTDPDYDRSYDRYFKGVTPNQSLNLGPYNVLRPLHLQHKSGFPQLGRLPRTQTSVGYIPSNPTMGPYCAAGFNQTPMDPVYVQWPNPAMMYTQSYELLKHAVFQAPFYQQPLRFEHSLNRQDWKHI